MVLPRQLTLEEAELLNALLVRLSERAKYPLTLGHLLRQWQNFVVQVERGYEDAIYEYTNDLSIRNLWEEILRGVTPKLREELARLIRPWDERFYNATKETNRPILSDVQDPHYWWWCRVPKKLGEEIEADFRFEGILKR